MLYGLVKAVFLKFKLEVKIKDVINFTYTITKNKDIQNVDLYYLYYTRSKGYCFIIFILLFYNNLYDSYSVVSMCTTCGAQLNI